MLPFKLNRARYQRGAILVELAIVLPLLLVLALGFAEFGLAFYRLNTLNKAVEDGARYFADPVIARIGGNPINAIDTCNSDITGGPAVAKNIVVYGQPTPGTAILPGMVAANVTLCDPAPHCTPTPPACAAGAALPADHFRITATYTHNFMTASALSNLIGVASGYNLTASTVMRVE